MERTMCGLSEPTHVTRDLGDMKSETEGVLKMISYIIKY